MRLRVERQWVEVAKLLLLLLLGRRYLRWVPERSWLLRWVPVLSVRQLLLLLLWGIPRHPIWRLLRRSTIRVLLHRSSIRGSRRRHAIG